MLSFLRSAFFQLVEEHEAVPGGADCGDLSYQELVDLAEQAQDEEFCGIDRRPKPKSRFWAEANDAVNDFQRFTGSEGAHEQEQEEEPQPLSVLNGCGWLETAQCSIFSACGTHSLDGDAMGGPDTANQDAIFVWCGVEGDPSLTMFGVMDGHGPCGSTFARAAAWNFPRVLAKKLGRQTSSEGEAVNGPAQDYEEQMVAEEKSIEDEQCFSVGPREREGAGLGEEDAQGVHVGAELLIADAGDIPNDGMVAEAESPKSTQSDSAFSAEDTFWCRSSIGSSEMEAPSPGRGNCGLVGVDSQEDLQHKTSSQTPFTLQEAAPAEAATAPASPQTGEVPMEPSHVAAGNEFARGEAAVMEPLGLIEPNILEEAFAEVDDIVSRDPTVYPLCSGSTATLAVIQGNQLTVANVGDSHCVLGLEVSTNMVIGIQLTVQHWPEGLGERQRIEQCNGEVLACSQEAQIGRVVACHGDDFKEALSLSRSLGNVLLKRFGLISTPEVMRITLDHSAKFLIVGSSGLWNALSPTEAARLASLCDNRHDAAKELVSAARLRWAHAHGPDVQDDVTAVVMFLDCL